MEGKGVERKGDERRGEKEEKHTIEQQGKYGSEKERIDTTYNKKEELKRKS